MKLLCTNRCADSSHAADHLAAGSADSAVQLLNRQIAMVNFKPMRQNAVAIFLGSRAFLPGKSLLLCRGEERKGGCKRYVVTSGIGEINAERVGDGVDERRVKRVLKVVFGAKNVVD